MSDTAKSAVQPHDASEKPSQPATERRHAKRRLNDVYVDALPITCQPLPTFVPHNPLSVLHVFYAVLSGYLARSRSHPSVRYKGYFSAATQSVHITDPDTVRALWERGFFGKGSLSRSDPSWLDRERRRRGLTASETSEEHTRARRLERKQMKYERALKERETIEQQLRDEGKSMPETSIDPLGEHVAIGDLDGATSAQEASRLVDVARADLENEANENEDILENEEHLQLTLEETFFLVYALGVLDVYIERQPSAAPALSLLPIFRQCSYYPSHPQHSLQPDDPFLLKYVVYHHFRSLGWVVRHGNKFSVDFLLYNRGPVFAHAEFAVIILPSYSHSCWTATPERRDTVVRKQSRDWWWFHCINRVQAHVRKTLIVVYVDIPPPTDGEASKHEVIDVAALLKQYTVREFTIRRWLMNRSRD